VPCFAIHVVFLSKNQEVLHFRPRSETEFSHLFKNKKQEKNRTRYINSKSHFISIKSHREAQITGFPSCGSEA
jgi:hypothetical protein